MHRHLMSSHPDPRVRRAAEEAHQARDEAFAYAVKALWLAIGRLARRVGGVGTIGIDRSGGRAGGV